MLDQTATQTLEQLASGAVSAAEVTQAYLDRAASLDENVGAFLSLRSEQALAEARQIDDQRAAGKPLGKLAGLPVAVKDVLCTNGETTTCGSRMLEHFAPPYDSTVVAKLKAAGAIIVGKTNMDEFAMGGSTENSAYKPTANPWDVERTPGGSSGGSAACVAASMAPLAIGTDTGGSIRQPAGFCGITGMKPTYGRVSRYGLVAFASSLDQVGPMTWTAEDAALLLEVIAGHDPLDSTSVDESVPEYSKTVAQPLEGLSLGIVREHLDGGLDPEVETAVREAIGAYESMGATIREVALPHSKYAVATYYLIAPSEASGNLARYDGVHYGRRTDVDAMRADLKAEDSNENPLVRMYRQSRSEGFGPEVQRRVMLGTYALSAGYYDAYYLKALKVRRLIQQDYDAAFNEVDLIIGPVTAAPAFKLGEKSQDPLSMYLVDSFTAPANLAGIPGISIPCGQSSGGLPIGLQLQGPVFAEDRLLRAAHMYQQATDWHERRPTI
ncbi:MAG: Asp-tRNA(Asn)/Glu-tRNA(Gln) amidotransferase subunit GatA [Pirellulales bacterium]|nr:Asp-tRNA(Asn)/Glu-tRNA(Gln) amidotransferase subunit GatA [Pirellulales bacterium]